jgi:cell division septum initiation protein DivIVA
VKFRERVIQILEQLKTGINTAEVGVEKLDEALCQRVQSALNLEEIVEEFHEVLDKASKSSFRITRPTSNTKKAVEHKSDPWWTQNLTILREKLNARRRRYQRMKGSTALLEQQQYLTTKAEYAKTIRKARYESWKKCFTITPAINPWNKIYRSAAGKRKKQHSQIR